MTHNAGGNVNFITPYGGRAVELMNRHTSPIRVGDVVQLSAVGLKSFTIASAGAVSPIGVSFESVAVGELCWIVTDGPQPALLQGGTGCANNDILRMSATEAGRVVVGGTGTVVGWALQAVAPGTSGEVMVLLRAESSEIVWSDVTAYGARGDGVTDDTTAIQNAISAVSSGGVVYFPSGSYVVSAYLHLVDSAGDPLERVTFRGDGESSILLGSFPADNEASGASVFFASSAVSDLEFKDFQIQAGGGATGYQRGFRFVNGATRISIRRVNVTGAGWDGLHTAYSGGMWFDAAATDCTIEDCRITSLATSVWGGYGIMFYTGAGGSNVRVAIRRCTIIGRTAFLPQGGIWVFNALGSIIEENVVQDIGHITASPDNSGYGIMVYGFASAASHAQIVGNTVSVVDGTGIYVQNNPRSFITRNRLYDVCKVQDGGSLLTGGICVNKAPAVIEGNIVIGVGIGSVAPNPPSGIQIQTELSAGTWPTSITEGIRVIGNMVQTTLYYGIRLRGTVVASVIDGNTCMDTRGGIGNDNVGEYPQGCVFSNNTIVRQGVPVDGLSGIGFFNPMNCTFLGNIISRAAGHGIFLSGGQFCTLSGNTIRDSGQILANACDGINLAASTDITVNGNTSWGKQQRYGINGSGAYLTVVGNAFGGDTGGINFAGPPANLINEHNQDVNIA
jgi:parallel beta-helix repeat protein